MWTATLNYLHVLHSQRHSSIRRYPSNPKSKRGASRDGPQKARKIPEVRTDCGDDRTESTIQLSDNGK